MCNMPIASSAHLAPIMKIGTSFALLARLLAGELSWGGASSPPPMLDLPRAILELRDKGLYWGSLIQLRGSIQLRGIELELDRTSEGGGHLTGDRRPPALRPALIGDEAGISSSVSRGAHLRQGHATGTDAAQAAQGALCRAIDEGA